MRRPEFIARQGRCPTGLLGRLLGRVMALETAAANARALELLECQPADSVLEVGFGHGRTIARAASLVPQGLVAGVDLSAQMVRMATDRNRRLIRAGRVELQLGDSARLPYPDRRFDKVYAMHTLYFWSDPREHVREIRRVMQDGARLVLGFRPSDAAAAADFPETIYRFYTSDAVRGLLAAEGFERMEMVAGARSAPDLVFAVAHR